MAKSSCQIPLTIFSSRPFQNQLITADKEAPSPASSGESKTGSHWRLAQGRPHRRLRLLRRRSSPSYASCRASYPIAAFPPTPVIVPSSRWASVDCQGEISPHVLLAVPSHFYEILCWDRCREARRSCTQRRMILQHQPGTLMFVASTTHLSMRTAWYMLDEMPKGAQELALSTPQNCVDTIKYLSQTIFY